MHVLATAGHVDHGKSTLVRALTGSDPDRLAEERRRGLSIELGYAWTDLDPVGQVAFVDVPGHERFVSTMLAGVGPVPAVVFVVAADDPWMPQAAEHLAALDALGVRHGLLAVTRTDLADPAPATARALSEIAGTTLGRVPAVQVSGRSGAGLDALRRAVADLVTGLPVPDPEADVRIWVDRVFHVRGAGTVVTGTLPAGTVSVGDILACGAAEGSEVRVRSLECLGRPVDRADGVSRVALNLAGPRGRLPAGLVRGGFLLTPGRWPLGTVVDVRLAGPGPLPERPVLHVGAASVAVRSRPLDERTVRLTLEGPLPLRVGDRALVRDPGNRRVWGVVVLDPEPPPLRRRGAAAGRAAVLATADGSLAAEVTRRGVVARSQLVRLGVGATGVPAGVVEAGGWLLSATRVRELGDRMPEVVREHATRLDPGVPVATVARALGLPDPELVKVVAPASLRVDRGRVLPVSAPGLPEPLLAALEVLRGDLAVNPFAAPGADRLRELGLGPRALGALAAAGHVLRVNDQVVLLAGSDVAAVHTLRLLPQPFTTSEARTALGTSRRVALALLAHLDRAGATTRLPDDRRVVAARGERAVAGSQQ